MTPDPYMWWVVLYLTISFTILVSLTRAVEEEHASQKDSLFRWLFVFAATIFWPVALVLAILAALGAVLVNP